MSVRDWVIYTTHDDGTVTWRTLSVEEMYERRLRGWARRVNRLKAQAADAGVDVERMPSPPAPA